MSAFLSDLRHAVRLLWKSPTFTLTAVVCLGLAIGANTTLFGILNSLLWKPLPVEQPGRLVRLYAKTGGSHVLSGHFYQGFSYPEYVDYRDGNHALAGLAATSGVQLGFRAEGRDAIRVFGEAVSDNYFEMLGVRARLGRVLAPGPGGALNTTPEVVLSHRFWVRRLHSTPDIVGKTIWLSGVAYTVVGVTPPSFSGTYLMVPMALDVWLPLGTLPLVQPGGQSALDDRTNRSLNLLGRMRADVDVAQAQAALATVAARLEQSYPKSNKGVTALVFRDLDTRPEVYTSRAVNLIAFLLLGLAGLVLIVACANLANLLLARAGARRKEIALRLALGARRGQLVQQLVTEALVLSLLAGSAGLLVAYAAARAVSTVSLPTDLPFLLQVTIDPRVLWFTLAVSLFAGVAFGLLPALGASRPDLVPALKAGDATPESRRRRLTLTDALVISQVAFSLVLLVVAGLFWRSIAGARTVDPGMRLERRTLVSFSPSLVRYDQARSAAFYRALVERVSRSPEIENAGLAGWVPLGFQVSEGTFVVRGTEARPDSDKTRSFVNVVTPGFLDTVGVPLRQGRRFTEQDTNATLPVVIVNETLARLAWPGQNPIGRQLRADRTEAPWLTVVGVVADGKYRALTEAPRPYLLYPLAQSPSDDLTLVALAKHDHPSALAAIRREVRALDPDMPLLDVKTMEQQMARVLFLPQAMAALAGPAAGLAMLIAAFGLYGVVAYSVGRRTREFGIKLAIGAESHDLVRQVMSQGLAIVGVGLGLGGMAALGVARVMRGVLVGVGSTDPAAFAGALGVLVGVAALAIYLPARRASRVDPLSALREE
jgi:predicted permease